MNGNEWWREAVFYQVYVRSFQDADGDGVGDLRGILQRLDHLRDPPGGPGRALGVDALWLTPITPSPQADFGYDVADYCAVDPLFGSLGDLDRLVVEAHERGLRIILDFVPNHTSDRHPWFVDSRSSRTSTRRDWYVWRDPAPGGGVPNNWRSAFGGPAWTLDPRTGQYYLHSFLAEQPDLDHRNPAVRQAMEDVLRFWLDRGVDGFRVDVVHKLVKDAALRDNPAADPADVNPVRDYGDQRHLHDQDQPGVHDLLRAWRRLLGTYERDRVMVGEVFLFDPARVATYYGTASDELPLAFNFSFLFSPWDAAAFRAQVDRFEAVLPAGAQPTLVLSNHDVPRHRTRYDDPAWGDARARLAATMLLTLRGTPFLYYGEEIGMRHVHVPADRIQDPVGHRLPAFGRDPSRTPMQWSDAPNAGFSAAARTWLPVGDAAVNVRAQTDDPRSLLAHYRRLLAERRRSAGLRRGAYRPLDGPSDTFVYVREHPDERILVALNFRGEARTLALPGVAGGRVRLSTHPERPLDRVGDRLSLQPVEGVIVDLP